MGVDSVFRLCSYVKCKKTLEDIEPYEIFKDNSLFPIAEINKEYDYFISNKKDKNEPMSPVINGRYCYPEEISIESDLPEKHLIWFNNKYKKQIEKLKEIYGKENVEVKYGITFEVF